MLPKKYSVRENNKFPETAIDFKQAETSQEIKVKLNESRLLKFYQVKQLKENSTENSAKKNFKENSKLNELWNKAKKKKKKMKILKFKELCFPDTLSDKFQQIVLKFATLPFLSVSFV